MEQAMEIRKKYKGIMEIREKKGIEQMRMPGNETEQAHLFR